MSGALNGDALLVTAPDLRVQAIGTLLVTPSGGSQQTLAAALASGGGGGGGLAAPVTLPAGTAASISGTPRLTQIEGGSGITTFTLPTTAAINAGNGNGQPYIVGGANGNEGANPQTIVPAAGWTLSTGLSSAVIDVNGGGFVFYPNTTTSVWSVF